MKTKKVVGKIFDANYVILLELEDGSKFEIIIIPTRRFV